MLFPFLLLLLLLFFLAYLPTHTKQLKDRLRGLGGAIFIVLEYPNTTLLSTFISYIIVISILINCVMVVGGGSIHSLSVQQETCHDPLCVPGEPGR